MNRFIAWLDNFLDYMGLGFSIWSDRARAGLPPKGFDFALHHALAQLGLTIGPISKDCLFVDVSRWQLEIDFVKLRNAGVRGVIMKCGQGAGIDPYFRINWQKAKAAGLLRGCYWFFDSRIDPRTQAKLWADTMKSVGFGELPYFFDYEETYGGDWGGTVNLADMMREFMKLTGFPASKIGIYTGYFHWAKYGTSDAFWSQFWLWIAWYGDEEDVLIPPPWTREKLFGWQFTASGDGGMFGVSSKEIDLNWFAKGLVIFEALFGDTLEPEIPTGEDGMYRVYSKTNRMSLRQTPTAFGAYVEGHNAGTIFICDRIGIPPISGGLPSDKWCHVVEVNGVEKDLYVAEIHNGVRYCEIPELIGESSNPVATLRFVDETGRVWVGEAELRPE